MAEEQEHDGTWSGLVKTIVGTLATVITAGGAWLGSQLFGGDDKADAAQPAPPSIVINNTQQQQQQPAGKTVIIKEKSAAPAPAPKPKPKTAKEELEEAPKW